MRPISAPPGAARAPAERGSAVRLWSAAGDRWDDGDRLAVGDVGGQAVEEPDVVVGNEHVDEAAQLAVLVEDALAKARMRRLERRQHLADGIAGDCHLGFAPGEGPQSCRYSHGDAHLGGLRFSWATVGGSRLTMLPAPTESPSPTVESLRAFPGEASRRSTSGVYGRSRWSAPSTTTTSTLQCCSRSRAP